MLRPMVVRLNSGGTGMVPLLIAAPSACLHEAVRQNLGQEQHQSDAHEDADHVDAKVSLLAIAYHNAGVAQESLGRHDHAVDSLVNAANLARTRLGWAN